MKTIGELAKLANVSVRTLQYYDKIGLLNASETSEGGRRLYHENDLTVLHQIITLKSLGLSLKEIKKFIIPINSTEDILKVLDQQSKIIKEQINTQEKVLNSIEMFNQDIKGKEEVDWTKYANMVKMIQENNDYYWVANFLDEAVLNDINDVHQNNKEEMPSDWLMPLFKEVIILIEKGVSPGEDEGQVLAQQWWQVISKYMETSNVDFKTLHKFYESGNLWPEEFSDVQRQSKEFLEKAIESYINKNNLEEILKL